MSEPRFPWDATNELLLKLLAEKGFSALEIAQQMRTTRGTIIGKCWRMKIKLAGEVPLKKGERKKAAMKAVKPFQHRVEKARPPQREKPRPYNKGSITSSTERAVYGLASRPRRFSWEEALDTPAEPA